jgi:hypothetical protein
MIQGRVRAGLARAKSDGKKLTSDARRHGKGYLMLAILLLGLALSPASERKLDFCYPAG